MQIKLLAVFAFILLFLIIILIRIVYINVKSGNRYAQQVLSQENYDSQTLYSRRGEIQDVNGRLLAYSEKVYDVVLDCYAVNRNEDYIEPTVDTLVTVFDLDRSDLMERITSEKTKDSQYQVVLEKITEEQKEAYEEYVSLDPDRDITQEERQKLQNVTGVWFEEEFVRRYPMNSLASDVIGFSNSIGDGIAGLEAYYDSGERTGASSATSTKNRNLKNGRSRRRTATRCRPRWTSTCSRSWKNISRNLTRRTGKTTTTAPPCTAPKTSA